MRLQKFNDVKMFKTAECSSHNDGQWIGVFEDRYDLEVKDGKARVFSNNPFAHKPSNWCKLKLVKELPNTNKNVFRLRVNGQYAFFKVAINLPKGHYYGK